MWKKPDFLLIAVICGIVGASCLGAGYIFLIAAHPGRLIQPSPPVSATVEINRIPEATPDNASGDANAEIPDSSQDTGVTQSGAVRQLTPKVPAPPAFSLVDHRYDGVITPAEVSQIKASLRLSPEQEPKWHALATAFRDVGTQQRARIDAGLPMDSAYNEEILATLTPSALPLVQSLHGDQVKGAGRLARALGFKTIAAMVEAANASAEPVAPKPKVEPRVAVTPVLPPAAKAPVLSNHRYDGLLTAAEINRIKLSLKLRPEQEAYWPPVAAILRELGQQQMAQVDAGQQLDNSMSGGMAQRFYFAASPLLQTLSEEQKSEVRRRARSMGLEAYASYL